MKRSEINAIMREGLRFLHEYRLTIDYPNYCRGVLHRTSPLADKAVEVLK
jgi:hypothetical protein